MLIQNDFVVSKGKNVCSIIRPSWVFHVWLLHCLTLYTLCLFRTSIRLLTVPQWSLQYITGTKNKMDVQMFKILNELTKLKKLFVVVRTGNYVNFKLEESRIKCSNNTFCDVTRTRQCSRMSFPFFVKTSFVEWSKTVIVSCCTPTLNSSLI